MRNLSEIIVHCTATHPEWMVDKPLSAKVDEVRRWHVQDHGWKDIGYHFLIDRDGSISNGRPLEQTGAHTQGHNTETVGIALIGGYGSSAKDNFYENFTTAQETSLRNLIENLKSKYNTIKSVNGHNQYAAKACPGFHVPTWYVNKATPPAPRTNPTQSTTVQASAVQIASGAGAGLAAVGALDGTAQIIAIALCGVVILAAAWIMRERLRKWADGDK